MNITDLLKEQAIRLGVSAKDKDEALQTLISLHDAAGNLSDRAQYEADIYKRESEATTSIGNGLAIPHAKSAAVKEAGLAVITVPEGVDCQSMDGSLSKLFFMIAAPEGGNNLHLEILARLMKLMVSEEFINQLLACKDPKEFLALVDAQDEAQQAKEEARRRKAEERAAARAAAEAAAAAAAAEGAKAPEAPAEEAPYKILAVTACPTGIAHTYMAAEALEKAGAEMGVTIKVETDGSGGAKNVLTRDEIAACDAIIVAADREIEMARFNGKKVLKTKVADGIHKPQELISRAVSGDVPVYTHSGEASAADSGDGESVGRQIYKHLMNGVSHMLPFVIGGGILIALAFLLDDFSIDPANYGMNTPVAAFFKTVGGVAFNFMLPILAGYIAMSIADRPGLVVGFVGGELARLGVSFGALGGGVSGGFLGALFAGFVGGYMMLLLKKLCDKLPAVLEGIKPVFLYPVFGVLGIGLIMCAVNPVMGWLNTGLTNLLNSMGGTSKVLLGAILGGMMSIDMGGPFNKAAYVFGTASLASGNYDIMAAVMVGGMVPPIVIALSTTFFPKKWSADERKSGIVNYIMGLCFISEGAIPFAAADPLRVIPSCIIGSAVSGALSMLFGCTLRAPHGGVFVFPVVGNALMYVLALVIGSVVGAVILTALKKNRA